jgi:hypothetical protein
METTKPQQPGTAFWFQGSEAVSFESSLIQTEVSSIFIAACVYLVPFTMIAAPAGSKAPLDE